MKGTISSDSINKNNNRSKIRAGLLTIFFLFVGLFSFGQEKEDVSVNSLEDYNDYDLNQDQQWDRKEFDTRMREEGLPEAWDTNRDRQLSREELEAGLQEKQNKRFEVKEHVIGNYAIVEVNEDDSVNLAGPASPRLNLDIIDEWDLDNDGTYTEAELNEGMFDYWDRDDSGFLDYEEYTATFFTDDYEE